LKTQRTPHDLAGVPKGKTRRKREISGKLLEIEPAEKKKLEHSKEGRGNSLLEREKGRRVSCSGTTIKGKKEKNTRKPLPCRRPKRKIILDER